MNENQIKAALASDHQSQAAYTGRVTQTETVQVITDEGVAIQKEITIYLSWDSINAILGLVRDRAGL